MKWIKTILELDPGVYLERVAHLIHGTNRRQYLSMKTLFPPIPGKCSCGCNKDLTGRRTRWATNDCTRMPEIIMAILQGHTRIIYRILAYRDGEKCNRCQKGRDQLYREYKAKDVVHQDGNVLEVDHVVPVCAGGSGRWLDNYQLLCRETCHRAKSQEDRKLCRQLKK